MCLPTVAQTKHTPTKRATVSMVNKGDTVGITAYSDTTSATTTSVDSLASAQPMGATQNHTFTITDIDNPFSLLTQIGTLGFGGILIALLCLFLVILIFVAPLVLIALLIYWLLRRNRTEPKSANKAIGSVQSEPNYEQPQSTTNRELTWQKGINHAAIGVGLIIFGLFIGDFFIAVGAILTCWGIGQCVIARTTASGNKPTTTDDSGKEDSQTNHIDDTAE